MISIGNDIVALDQTNAERTLQKRFFSQILSESEIVLFKEGNFQIPFETFIWLAWSIKESVYKFIKRHNEKATFSPTKIIVKELAEPGQLFHLNAIQQEGISFRNHECFCCKVLYNNHYYHTRSFVNNHVIFTVANEADCFENIFWGVQQISPDTYSHQTNSVRQFVLQKLKQELQTNQLAIEKTATGIPFIASFEKVPLSLTHHGNFIGYSFILQS